ncbi:Serine/threonine protein phosphatase 2A 55 kDa regulatory subunit B beta isoform [Vitis vinifera]|uniref:Serine/threonine-protein phosphatase 2A 55 kDa regulatory subunit B n=1 Tax=Vitis vinifera TaxID=29760 RepID=A0A438EXG9_VITVI|nr:Serine/threonine protein phosphatase 2A 55 kDa regulatory subunit B beta isoform [Vitis vinifera]
MNGIGGEEVTARAGPARPLEWKFAQVFGERAFGEEVQEGKKKAEMLIKLPSEWRIHHATSYYEEVFVVYLFIVDIISAIEFDKTGDHLATGDRGGRVVLFNRTDMRDHGGNRRDLETADYSPSRHPEFHYKTEFQSHEPEFDYLKSLEIEEKINKIRWCQTANSALFLLSTNDKTIKFWKVQEKKVKKVCDMNVDPSKALGNDHLTLLFFSIYSDGETFISADDLRINLWNLEISSQSFNIVDVKPANMEDLTVLCLVSCLHDLEDPLVSEHSRFEELEAPTSRSFFTEIIASISDIKFSKDGRHLLSRDYMTLKLWDINMESVPVATFQVHEHLRPKLCDLYENDSIFDKFECCLSGDGLRVATGSYSNLFRVFGCSEGSTEATTLEANKNPMMRQVQTPSRPSRSLGSLSRVGRRARFTFRIT